MYQAEAKSQPETCAGRGGEEVQQACDDYRQGYGDFDGTYRDVYGAGRGEGQCYGVCEGEGGDDLQQVAGGFADIVRAAPGFARAPQDAGEEQQDQEGQVVVAD